VTSLSLCANNYLACFILFDFLFELGSKDNFELLKADLSIDLDW
jgi:hypothetical protein